MLAAPVPPAAPAPGKVGVAHCLIVWSGIWIFFAQSFQFIKFVRPGFLSPFNGLVFVVCHFPLCIRLVVAVQKPFCYSTVYFAVFLLHVQLPYSLVFLSLD